MLNSYQQNMVKRRTGDPHGWGKFKGVIVVSSLILPSHQPHWVVLRQSPFRSPGSLLMRLIVAVHEIKINQINILCLFTTR